MNTKFRSLIDRAIPAPPEPPKVETDENPHTIIIPKPSPTELLSKILDVLSQNAGTDVPSDQVQQTFHTVTAGQAGRFDVPSQTDFTWYLIYNTPASGTVGLGPEMGKPVGDFAAGVTIWGRFPRGSILSVQYDAPVATGQFVVYLSTRPLQYEYLAPNPVIGTATSGSQEVTIVSSSTGNAVAVAATTIDNQSTGTQSLFTVGLQHAFDGTAWDRIRVESVFKPSLFNQPAFPAAAVVWVPTAGRRFRLMGALISFTTTDTFELQDGGNVFARGTASNPIPTYFDFGQGYLSTAVNNQLTVLAGTAGTQLNGTFWGTEEI